MSLLVQAKEIEFVRGRQQQRGYGLSGEVAFRQACRREKFLPLQRFVYFVSIDQSTALTKGGASYAGHAPHSPTQRPHSAGLLPSSGSVESRRRQLTPVFIDLEVHSQTFTPSFFDESLQ